MIRLILLISMITFAYTAPAYKGAIKFEQSDGSTFSGKLKGDEWFNWVEDKQGDIIKYNKKSKNYEYGVVKEVNGTLDLAPSDIKVGNKPAGSDLGKIDKKTLIKIWKEKKEKALKYKKD
ncbi:MAG TPA: hypothetical protein VLL31_00575 [Sulfurovum sp.]|nr:hypothetical protein [Sulfurovum sp.]